MERASAATALRRALAALPHLLTAARMASAPLIALLIAGNQMPAAALLVAAAMATDYLDGPLVRRFGTPSTAGAYFDVWADFLTVLGAFGGLGATGVVPLWPLLPICLSFALFLLTSRHRPTIYDPVGRYLGGVLMIAALLLLVVEDFLVQDVVLWTAAIASASTMLGRLALVVPRARRPG